jgi:hypothetical protein
LRFNYSHLLDYTVCINKFEKKKRQKRQKPQNHKTPPDVLDFQIPR